MVVVRVAETGTAAFQLRKGEEGISVFDPEAVDPPLTEDEILAAFRPGSVAVTRSNKEVESKGLQIIAIEGAELLPLRLRMAHAEIRPSPNISRSEFKKALKELE